MSYDLYIGDDSFNYTFNVSALFYDHMPADANSERGGLHTLHGLTGRQAGDKIADALDRIGRTMRDLWKADEVGEPRFCAKYDANNGWGSALGGVMLLSLVMAACYQNPRKRLRVSS
jgi:hypothetical protein